MKTKNLLLTLSLIALICIGCTSENKINDITRNELKGKIKEYNQTIYDIECYDVLEVVNDDVSDEIVAAGEPTENYDTTLITRTSTTFDKAGFVTGFVKNCTYANNTSMIIKQKITNRTDSIVSMLSQTIVERDDEELANVLEQITTHYDTNGNVIEQSSIGDEVNTKIEYTYNIDGFLMLTKVFSNYQKVSTTKYTYDEQNRKKTYSISDTNKETGFGKFFYDENSMLTKQVDCSKVNDYRYAYQYIEYKYDNKGNNIQQIKKYIDAHTELNKDIFYSGDWQKISAYIEDINSDYFTYVWVKDAEIKIVYDKHNNMIERCEYLDGKKTKSIICDISYY